jgi:hypothetical protein
MEQHDIRQEQTRGIRASELLGNELLQEALAAIKTEVVEQWEACPARDQEGKEALWQLMKTAGKFEGLLRGHIETGKLATEQLKRWEEEQSRLKRFANSLRRA